MRKPRRTSLVHEVRGLLRAEDCSDDLVKIGSWAVIRKDAFEAGTQHFEKIQVDLKATATGAHEIANGIFELIFQNVAIRVNDDSEKQITNKETDKKSYKSLYSHCSALEFQKLPHATITGCLRYAKSKALFVLQTGCLSLVLSSSELRSHWIN